MFQVLSPRQYLNYLRKEKNMCQVLSVFYPGFPEPIGHTKPGPLVRQCTSPSPQPWVKQTFELSKPTSQTFQVWITCEFHLLGFGGLPKVAWKFLPTQCSGVGSTNNYQTYHGCEVWNMQKAMLMSWRTIAKAPPFPCHPTNIWNATPYHRCHYITNPNNALIASKIPENYHTFALFHPPRHV